jgi:hypothetical protein
MQQTDAAGEASIRELDDVADYGPRKGGHSGYVQQHDRPPEVCPVAGAVASGRGRGG